MIVINDSSFGVINIQNHCRCCEIMNNNFLDDKGQISAEMVLLIGAILVIVIVAGGYIVGITGSIAGNITTVVDTARDTTINRM